MQSLDVDGDESWWWNWIVKWQENVYIYRSIYVLLYIQVIYDDIDSFKTCSEVFRVKILNNLFAKILLRYVYVVHEASICVYVEIC